MDWHRFWNTTPQVHLADARRQVGRTFEGQPISDRELELLAIRLVDQLRPRPTLHLLDICCGNGLLTSRLAPHFAEVIGVDFSAPLIESAISGPNIRYVVADAMDLPEWSSTFDRVLVAAAFQFFDATRAARLLGQLEARGSEECRLVISDIPDRDRRHQFYRGVRGRLRFVYDEIRDRPAIGCWWRKRDVQKLAETHGWAISFEDQPVQLSNHYFRFDAILERHRTPLSHKRESVAS